MTTKYIEIPLRKGSKSKRKILLQEVGVTNLDEETLLYLVQHPEHDKDLPEGLAEAVKAKRNPPKPVEDLKASKKEEDELKDQPKGKTEVPKEKAESKKK